MVAARIRSRADQEELVQRALSKTWTGLGDLKSPFPGAFRAWCRRIARNTVIDFVRAGQRSPETGADPGDPPDPFTPETAVSLAEQREALAHCMAELPDAQREVFELHAVDGLKYREIAELRDCAVGTVGPTLAAARRNLIACLERRGAIPE